MTKRIGLVDVAHLFWSSWYASGDLPVSEAFERTITGVHKHTASYDYAAVCCDSPPYDRKLLFREYKSNREAQPHVAIEQFARAKQRLKMDGLLLWECAGLEADDVIATACDRAISDGLAVTIVSGDKDLLACISDQVRVVKTQTGEVFGPDEVVAKFGVPPDQMRDLLALCGDSSDNVPGVPGIGPKTAAKLLHDFGDIDKLLARLDTLPPGKIREAIFTNADQLRLSRKLVTLRTDAPINWAEIYEERAPQRLTEEDDMGDMVDDDPDEDGPSELYREEETAPKVEVVSKPAPEKPDALAVHSGNGNGLQSFEQGLQPGTLEAAYRLAKALYNSRLYTRFPNEQSIFAIMIRGREMGLGALTSLDNFHVIEGKPSPLAHLLVARAKGHPDCEYFRYVAGDGTFAEYETKHRRNPSPTRLKYTYAQAERAGITKSQKGRTNWEKRPDEMLRKTCAVQLARIEYPEVLQGMYAVEEME